MATLDAIKGALAVGIVGAAIPTALTDLSPGATPNTAEWVLSALFALAALLLLVSIFRQTSPLGWIGGEVAGFGYWAVGAYLLLNPHIGALAGFSLACEAFALGAIALVIARRERVDGRLRDGEVPDDE